MKDLVSIIMPVYNCEKTVKNSILSVINQDYQNIELIIIDDGSTDNSYNICKKIKSDKIKLFTQKNAGPSSARNLGISNAKGTYIMFIDSDDIYPQSAIKNMISKITKRDFDIVIGNYKINNRINCLYKKDITFKNKSIALDFLLKNKLFNTNWNKIYSKKIIDKFKLRFDEKYKLGEDIRFNLSYFEHVNSVYYTKEIVYYYEMTADGLTLKNSYDKCRREVELLNIQYDYYKKNNHNINFISKKIAKAFFYINDVYFCLNNEEYLVLLKKASKYSIYSKVLAYLIENKREKTLHIILNIMNKLKR